MCGITIKKNEFKSLISHRGTKDVSFNAGNWNVIFNSLPLSSYNSGFNQPIEYKDIKLVFNGEIFNYKKLDRLARSDVHYLSNLIKKLNGDINLLFKESLKWDGFWSIVYLKDNKLYVFCDPLGKKQMYYSSEGVCSELKGLINKDTKRNAYSEKLFGTLETDFNNLYRFLPATLYCYLYETDRPYKVQFQDYFKESETGNLYDLINESIKTRLENKINGISLLLSGGLDSNIIRYHLQKMDIKFESISIENNESEIVKRIADKNNMEIKFIDTNINNADLDHLMYHYEHSIDYGSLIPNYLLFKHCAHHLVLTGDGSDELFSGYNRALKEDTWNYDTMIELPYYHNIRIDRMSMAWTKEARSPLMSLPLVRASKRIKWQNRKGKSVLRELYKDKLPDYIINGVKNPLRLEGNKEKNIQFAKDLHANFWSKYLE
jgi:asparagine synthase (glutamine-hydrolysing)